MSASETKTGVVDCCADVESGAGVIKLSVIGLRSEGGDTPVDPQLSGDAQQSLEMKLQPGDFVRLRVEYERDGERFTILRVLDCGKLENDAATKKSAQLLYSLQTTNDLPSIDW